MEDFEKLRETVETNFRLNALYTRQMGQRLDQRMDGLSHRMDGLGHHVDELANGMRDLSQAMKTVSGEMKNVGTEIRTDFDGLADRQEASIEALYRMADSNVDIHKEIAELKRRVQDLEDRAS